MRATGRQEPVLVKARSKNLRQARRGLWWKNRFAGPDFSEGGGVGPRCPVHRRVARRPLIDRISKGCVWFALEFQKDQHLEGVLADRRCIEPR